MSNKKEIVSIWVENNSEVTAKFEASRKALSSYGVFSINTIILEIKKNYQLSGTVFDTDFVKFIKEYQKSRGLTADGVLGMETLKRLDEDVPGMFDLKTKKAIENYKNWFSETEKKQVSVETKKELGGIESKLLADDVEPKNEVFAFAKKNIPLLWNTIEEMQSEITKFQEETLQNPATGKLEKRNFVELKTRLYLTDDKFENIRKNWLTEEDKKQILYHMQNWDILSKWGQRVITFVENLKKINQDNPEFMKRNKDFFEKFDNFFGIQRVQNEDRIAEARKNEKSLYAIIKDDKMSTGEKLKAIATDPWVLLVAGIAFLFGWFGDNTVLTNTWWKRLWILLLGPVAWDKIGMWEIIDDIWEKTDKVIKNWNKSAAFIEWEKTSKKVIKNAPNYLLQAKKSVSSGVDSVKETGIKMLDSLNKTATGFMDANKNLFEKWKWIEETKFEKMHTILVEDEKFWKTEISKLKDSLWDETKIKNLLSAKTLAKFSEMKVGKDDLLNYTKLLTEKAKSSQVYVWDIFVWENYSVLGKVFEKVEWHDSYLKDVNLNLKVKNLVSGLSDGLRWEVSLKLADSASKIDSLEENIWANKNYLSELLNKNLSLKDRNIIEKLEALYLMKYNFDKASKELENPNLSKDERNEIIEKFDKLVNKSKLDRETKLYFEAKVLNSENNLTDSQKDLIDTQVELWEFYQALEKIWKIPSSGSSIEEYKKFLNNDEKRIALGLVLSKFENENGGKDIKWLNYSDINWFEFNGDLNKLSVVEYKTVKILTEGTKIEAAFSNLLKNLEDLKQKENDKFDKFLNKLSNEYWEKNTQLLLANIPNLSKELSKLTKENFFVNVETNNLENLLRNLGQIQAGTSIFDNFEWKLKTVKDDAKIPWNDLFDKISQVKSVLEIKEKDLVRLEVEKNFFKNYEKLYNLLTVEERKDLPVPNSTDMNWMKKEDLSTELSQKIDAWLDLKKDAERVKIVEEMYKALK